MHITSNLAKIHSTAGRQPLPQPNCTDEPNANVNKQLTAQKTTQSVPRSNTNLQCPLGFLHIVTHVRLEGDKKYYFSKKGVTDDVLFIIKRNDLHRLPKVDRRHFKQYDATTQGIHLTSEHMELVTV